MAKSKNHTAHNQTYKQHKNGIKKQKKFRYSSRKGVRISFCPHCLTGEGPQRVLASNCVIEHAVNGVSTYTERPT